MTVRTRDELARDSEYVAALIWKLDRMTPAELDRDPMPLEPTGPRCRYCDAELGDGRRDRRYCSPLCRRRAWNKRNPECIRAAVRRYKARKRARAG